MGMDSTCILRVVDGATIDEAKVLLSACLAAEIKLIWMVFDEL